jgi:hypothetical protein
VLCVVAADHTPHEIQQSGSEIDQRGYRDGVSAGQVT